MRSFRVLRRGSVAALGVPAFSSVAFYFYEARQARRFEVAPWREPAGRRVLVLGGGVVGVASAYFLQKAGFDVTVLEREPRPGRVTSAASGCLLSIASNKVLASPQTLKRLGAAALGGDSWLTIQWRALLDFELIRWGVRFACTCFAPETRKRNEEFLRLHSPYFLRLIKDIAAKEGFADKYSAGHSGTLTVFEGQAAFEAAATAARSLPAATSEPLEREALLESEPQLAPRASQFAGAIFSRSDERGDCGRFTELLAEACARLGVRFIFRAEVKSLRLDGDVVTAAVLADGTEETADIFVVALGARAPQLLRPLDVDVPVYPIKGYSLILPAGDWGIRRPLVFSERQLGFIPLGQRLRFSGVAEIAGWQDSRAVPETVERLRADVAGLLPEAPWLPEALTKAEVCVGGRPMTPDDLPIVSGTRISNLWVNGGHCMRGWRTACGTAELLAALVVGAKPPDNMDPALVSLGRFRSLWRS
eukprot:TRINITY_DN5753_c0_g1_i1.p1 TRINITY_DN5753_c0_g1~~TRINITY_DN5753_c0_g1_i1.p1  ORF type:complete len:478 (-),score=59.74 TRINITY_DN5753_c0_g1_i1:177-1610(-)